MLFAQLPAPLSTQPPPAATAASIVPKMASWIAFAAVVAATCLSAATATNMKLLSMSEVMEQTTLASATKLMLSKHQSHTHGQALVSLIQSRLGQHSHVQGHFRKAEVNRHMHEVTTDPDEVSKDGATALLNSMLAETRGELEIQAQAGRKFNRSTLELLRGLRGSVSAYNGQANKARGQVLNAQYQISNIETQQTLTTAQLKTYTEECIADEAALRAELAIVTSDLNVMNDVLKMTKCGTDEAFIQTRAAVSDSTMVNCAHCNRGRGLVMMQSAKLQPMLNKLRSSTANTYLQHNLHFGFQQAARKFTPVALTQVGVSHMTQLAKGAARVHHRQHQVPNDNVTNVSDVPEEPIPSDCEFSSKCVLSAANCQSLQDRFLLISAAILDKQNELSVELATSQEDCKTQQTLMKEQLVGLRDGLGEENGNLAAASEFQSTAEQNSQSSGAMFETQSSAYHAKMGKFCSTQNDLMSERCALNKIRGELLKMDNATVYPIDCEVGDWVYEGCSKDCGGGVQEMERPVLVQSMGGEKCPPLTEIEDCNEAPCPIECVVEEWAGWSDCSAECGGGVKTRTRDILTKAQYEGSPCPETTEAKTCHSEACDVECVLNEWTEWTDCSKLCDIGHEHKSRTVSEPATGTGDCPVDTSELRLQYRPCNKDKCNNLMNDFLTDQNQAWNSFFTCDKMIDIVVLLDGSGSLGESGWARSKTFAKNFINSMQSNESNVQVGVMLFSGPAYWSDYYCCTSHEKCANPDAAVNMEEQCNIRWIRHLGAQSTSPQLTDEDTEKMIQNLEWPQGSTLTSIALMETKAELIKGREGADSVVVVITDGQPLSHTKTKLAAEQLHKAGHRVIWVPVGAYAPIEMIEELAYPPKDDNIVKIPTFRSLEQPDGVNNLLANLCGESLRGPQHQEMEGTNNR